MTKQLLDSSLGEYLILKEHWAVQIVDSICLRRQEVALKRVSKARQASLVKMCHNLRHMEA
jgi:hypothetical protein